MVARVLAELWTFDVLIQTLACIFTLIACWLIGDKDRRGFLLAIASEFVWIVIVVRGHLWGILPTTLVFLGIHTRNWIKWKPEEDVLPPGWSKEAMEKYGDR